MVLNPTWPTHSALGWDTTLNTGLGQVVDYVNSIGVNAAESLSTNTSTVISASAWSSWIASTPAGSTIWFPPRQYLVDGPVKYVGDRAYVGGGSALSGNGAIIKQANGENIAGGLFVPAGWASNATTSDDPVIISNLAFDGNRSNNGSSSASALILMNFWSRVENCHIVEAPAHGILLTDTTANGTNVIVNSASENRITDCKVTGTNSDGIRQVCAGGIANLDGYLSNNIISSTTGNGINFDQAAGWDVRRNHLYSIGASGIILTGCYATAVEFNYIEDFGNVVAAVFYEGIQMTMINGRGSTMFGNFVGCSEGSATPHYQYLHAIAANSATDARVAILGNSAHGPASPTGNGIGLVLDTNGGGALLHARLLGNSITSMNTLHYLPAITPTATAGANNGGSPPAPTILGDSTNDYGQVQFGSGTSPAAGAQVAVVFSVPYDTTPTVSLAALNAATVGLSLYVSSLSTTGFTVSTANAPAASQGGSIYNLTWIAAGI